MRKKFTIFIIELFFISGIANITSSIKINENVNGEHYLENSINSPPVLSIFRVEYQRKTIGGKSVIKIDFVGYDSENDEIMYFWRITDWGNRYITNGNWYQSGQPYSLTYKIEEDGELEFEGFCEDKHGEYSNRVFVTIDVPNIKSKMIFNSLLVRIIERFPIFEKIPNQII
jgi:hypothetical protein